MIFMCYVRADCAFVVQPRLEFAAATALATPTMPRHLKVCPPTGTTRSRFNTSCLLFAIHAETCVFARVRACLTCSCHVAVRVLQLVLCLVVLYGGSCLCVSMLLRQAALA